MSHDPRKPGNTCCCYWCKAKRDGLCADRYPTTPHSNEEPCTLNPGHSGLHEFHHPTHPADWPPVRRWMRMADGTVFPPNKYLTQSQVKSNPESTAQCYR